MKVETRNKIKSYKIRPIGASSRKNVVVKPEKDIESQIFQINESCLRAAIEHENINRFDNLQPREEIVESKSVCEIDLENPDECIENETEKDEKPKIRWNKYEKKYKVQWEGDPKLRGWMNPHPDDPGKVSCKYCKCMLRAHKTDLYKHSGTRKHNRNAANPMNYDNSKKVFLSVSSPQKKLKREQVMGPDGSYIILESEHGVLSPERDAGDIFVEYADNDTLEDRDEAEHTTTLEERDEPRRTPTDTDQEICDIASRIGVFLIDDIERILRTQKNVLRFFKENDQLNFSDSNLRKMAAVCVGHLSQKYLVESVVEARHRTPVETKEKSEIASKFRAMEETFERTVAEMKNLKMLFDGVSDVLPYAPIDLGHIISTPSTSHH